MAFGLKELSRHRGNPTKLFLFKGTDPTLESMMRSVTIIPGATEFGYGTTKVSIDVPSTSLPTIDDWNSIPRVSGTLVVDSLSSGNRPPAANPVVGLVAYADNIGNKQSTEVYAMDHVAMLGWSRTEEVESGIGGWGGWVETTYDPTIQDPAASVVPPPPVPVNHYADQPGSDFASAIDDLIATAPHLKHVSLVVAWHGTDLRCGECLIVPRVETDELATSPYEWRVGPITRDIAQLVSQVDGKPAYGGAPSDRSVYEAIVNLKERGLSVTLYPFIMLDIAEGNILPNPYGGTGQPLYPWRGRITCHPAPGESGTVDGTADATGQVTAFFGSADPADFSWNSTEQRVGTVEPSASDFGFSRFILHMATIAAAAGADDFLLCGELVGLTKVRDDDLEYPAVASMQALAAQVRSILGSGVTISYAADWSEFHSHQVDGDLRFHLDPLWADSNIDYVAIDAYFPVADWRDGFSHLDWLAGHTSIHDPFYIKSNIEGGELFDWYYASDADRTNQVRTPITDGAHGEPWVFRQKDIRSWWENPHHERIGGVRQVTATAWVPESKQIVFTELGCAAIEKGANQPNVFLDPKSSESTLPYFSNGRPDAAMLRVCLEAILDYWRPDGPNNNDMINYDRISLWTWDARPYPVFPTRADLFGDAGNWVTGHWLTGRAVPGRAFEHGEFGPYAFTNAETAITRAGITYQPWPIKHSDISTTGSLDKSDITITMATGSGLESEFIGYPPAQVINLTIFQGHMDDVPSLVDYPAQWLGRVTAPEFKDNEVAFNCVPVSASIQRPGLRRNYQLGCPHVLYGSACRANKPAATVQRTVGSITRNRVTFTAALGDGVILPPSYGGGLLEWTAESGRKEIRTIVKVSTDGTEITVRGILRGLLPGMTPDVVLGCPRTMAGCTELHGNILNFGGQPFIPLENPLSLKNHFY